MFFEVSTCVYMHTHTVLYKRKQNLNPKAKANGKWKTDFWVKVNFPVLYWALLAWLCSYFPPLSMSISTQGVGGWGVASAGVTGEESAEVGALIHPAQLCLVIETRTSHQHRNKRSFLLISSSFTSMLYLSIICVCLSFYLSIYHLSIYYLSVFLCIIYLSLTDYVVRR